MIPIGTNVYLGDLQVVNYTVKCFENTTNNKDYYQYIIKVDLKRRRRNYVIKTVWNKKKENAKLYATYNDFIERVMKQANEELGNNAILKDCTFGLISGNETDLNIGFGYDLTHKNN